ncbi:MAG: glycosyltransferase [Flavobacteriaceae bacterium]
MDEAILTVVMPCFNERDNIGPIVSEISRSTSRHLIRRIIFVDDNSPDGTAEHIKSLANTSSVELLCIHRIGRQGLSSAVAEGVMLADTHYVAVMDCDGQHDPADLKLMLHAALEQQAQLVIGSRFKNQRTLASHRGMRGLASRIGNRLARLVTGRNLTDPLTGFFLFERGLFNQAIAEVRPGGFKILVDILQASRGRDIAVREVQINFRSRGAGESKLDAAVLLEFADQIVASMTGGLLPAKFTSFAFIGLSGVLVHFAALHTLLFSVGLSFNAAQAGATLTAMVSNFALNNALTFRRSRYTGLSWFTGLFYFIVVCGFGAIANVGVAGYLNTHHETWWLSALAGILVGTIFNFAISNNYIWKPAG